MPRRKWKHMISTPDFIHTHFRCAPYGLLYQDKEGCVIFVSVRQGEIETFKIVDLCSVCTSCNGFVLAENQGNCFIVNLSTGKGFCLPPYPRDISSPFCIGIGYVAASTTYKVFSAHCARLTVGMNIYGRSISTDHLSSTARLALSCSPLINEGFMHWQRVGIQVVTLNLDTEIITETSPPIPTNVVKEKRDVYCFPTGRYLSLLILRGELKWEVWEMKPEMEEWRKLPDMCLEGQKDMMRGLGLKKGDRIKPCGWVKYQEVLALRIEDDYDFCRFVCFYNLVKLKVCSKNVITDCGYRFLLHKNSLVAPGVWNI